MERGNLLNLEINPGVLSQLHFTTKKSTILIWSHPTKLILGSDGCLT